LLGDLPNFKGKNSTPSLDKRQKIAEKLHAIIAQGYSIPGRAKSLIQFSMSLKQMTYAWFIMREAVA
jgi:hypothetical protein